VGNHPTAYLADCYINFFVVPSLVKLPPTAVLPRQLYLPSLLPIISLPRQDVVDHLARRSIQTNVVVVVVVPFDSATAIAAPFSLSPTNVLFRSLAMILAGRMKSPPDGGGQGRQRNDDNMRWPSAFLFFFVIAVGRVPPPPLHPPEAGAKVDK
jgi:hypothetical protein